MTFRKLAVLAAGALLMTGITGCKNKVPLEAANDMIIQSLKAEIEQHDSAKCEKPDLSQLNRNDFNHAALRLNLPIFWIYEENPSKELKPELLTSLKFYPSSDSFKWKNDKGEFTDDFYKAYRQMVEVMKDPLFGAVSDKDYLVFLKKYNEGIDQLLDDYSKELQAAAEDESKKGELYARFDSDRLQGTIPDWDAVKKSIHEYLDSELSSDKVAIAQDDALKDRLNKVAQELDQAAVTVVSSDFTKSDEKTRAFVNDMLEVGRLIDKLYARQLGIDKVLENVPESDTISRSMIRRNWGVTAQSPKMKNDKSCRAIAGDDKIYVGIYPEDLQKDDDFCAKLDARQDAETLLGHFSVVVKDGDDLKSVPYNEFFKDDMVAVSEALTKAAAHLEGNEKEEALHKYLLAAAESFKSNDWDPANEAWAAMNSTNSEWYVRVAPDETYWEPCSRHAGFHMTFARINPDALAWQEKLTPLQQDMEKEIAKIAGKPYKERKVSFHLPDFIDIVSNSGDDRNPFGATIGQSLPNWGPVANEGRGRTVAMSNLYTDPDSLRDRKELASSLFTEKDMDLLKDGKDPGLLSTIIHEAAHNLGPAHEYTVKGKKDNDIYGGALASMAEEFKAQTAALWYLPYLVKKGVIDQDLANKSYADSIYWAFGHIAKGMKNSEGNIQPYSQLAAIQVGMLMEDGALTYDAEATAANGKDKGAFIINFDKIPKSVERIMKAIAESKAKGDKAALEDLQNKHAYGKDIPFEMITERMLRLPKTSFVYSVNTGIDAKTDAKKDDAKVDDDAKKDDAKADDADAKKDDAKADDADAKKDDAKTDDADAKKDDAKTDDADKDKKAADKKKSNSKKDKK